MQQVRKLLFQEHQNIDNTPISLKKETELLFETSIQPKQTKNFYTPRMANQDQEMGENSRRVDTEEFQRTKRLKDPCAYTNNYGDTKVMPLEDIEK